MITVCLLAIAGNPPQCNAWMGQCGLYILVMIVEKILMTLLVQFHFWRDVSRNNVHLGSTGTEGLSQDF